MYFKPIDVIYWVLLESPKGNIMKLSPEERKERIKEYNKRRYQNMTDEQREEIKEYNKRRLQNMTAASFLGER